MLDRTMRRRLSELRLTPFDWGLPHECPVLNRRDIEWIASNIAHSICADDGYFRGVRFGAMTYQQVSRLMKRFSRTPDEFSVLFIWAREPQCMRISSAVAGMG